MTDRWPRRKLVVDSNENMRTPWRVPIDRLLVKHMQAGDYSLEGLEWLTAVERKAPDDLAQCVGKDRVRFRAQVERLVTCVEAPAIVITASLPDLASGNFRSVVDPRALVSTLAAWQVEFPTLHIIFAGDESHGFAWTRLFLRWQEKRWDRVNGEATRPREETRS